MLPRRLRGSPNPSGWILVVVCVGGAAGNMARASETQLEMLSLQGTEGPKVRGQVVGANPVEAKNWPASVVFTGTNGDACTATLVGPQAVIGAAHCIGDGAVGTVLFDSKPIPIKCDRHPQFDSLNYPSPDFALCYVDKAIGGIEYERINVDPQLLKRGDSVYLLGYGCIDKGGSKTYGTLYGGPAQVIDVPSDDLFTKTRGGAAICAGDSGGGAFTTQLDRVLVGINSSGDYETNSLLATTGTEAFVTWAKNWAATHKTGLCGVNAVPTGCRGSN